MVPNRSHVFVMVCNERIRKDPVILLATLKVMPQNHKKHDILTFCTQIYTAAQEIT